MRILYRNRIIDSNGETLRSVGSSDIQNLLNYYSYYYMRIHNFYMYIIIYYVSRYLLSSSVSFFFSLFSFYTHPQLIRSPFTSLVAIPYLFSYKNHQETRSTLLDKLNGIYTHRRYYPVPYLLRFASYFIPTRCTRSRILRLHIHVNSCWT